MEKLSPAWLAWKETHLLVKAFGEVPLRFVGGCVRDAILSRPVQDVDGATPLPPEEVMSLLAKATIKAIPTGIAHGTVTAVIGAHHFEITTLRRDISTDGRRATVAYTENWQEDAARRDFTMNALYCDAQGTVFDYFHGADDAKAGCIRFIGDPRTRIAEDALRILRFFRFFCHYGKGAADPQGLKACAELASKIETLSGERIQQEMLRLLVADTASEGVVLMQAHHVWPYVLPQAVDVTALSRLPDILRKTGHTPDALLALASLLRSIKKNRDAVIDALDTRWKLSKVDYKKLYDLCTSSVPLTTDEKMLKKQIRAFGKALFIEQVLLGMAEGIEESIGLHAIAFCRRWDIPQFPVTGSDLVAQGIAPGKKMGALLAQLETYWEEQGYGPSKEELLKQIN